MKIKAIIRAPSVAASSQADPTTVISFYKPFIFLNNLNILSSLKPLSTLSPLELVLP